MDVVRLIPQLYYDLLSRVFPGGMTILAVDFKLGSILAYVLEGASPLQGSAIVLALMVFIAAYLTGQIIAPLSGFLESHVATRLFPVHFRVVREAATTGAGYSSEIQRFLREELSRGHGADISTLKDPDYERAVAVWHDRLLIHDPGMGDRASKVRAEYRMYGGLAVAAIAFIVNHLAASLAPAVRMNGFLLLLAAVIGALCIWGKARTYRVFQRTIINSYYLEKTMPDAEKPQAIGPE